MYIRTGYTEFTEHVRILIARLAASYVNDQVTRGLLLWMSECMEGEHTGFGRRRVRKGMYYRDQGPNTSVSV